MSAPTADEQAGPVAPAVERPSERRAVLLAALLYFALTGVLAYPLSVHPASLVFWMSADTELFAWTLAWNTYALTHHPWSIFDANIFYPQRLTLAYSENLLGTTPFAAPVIWLTGNLVLALNVVSLLSCLLSGVGTFLLARRLGVSRFGAAVAGVVFAFSPPRFGRYGQLHLTTVQWIPFGLWALHGYLDTGRKRDLRLALAFFTLQALTSGHGGVFMLMAMGGLVAWRLALGDRLDLRRRLADVGVVGILLLLPALLVAVPYHIVQQQVGLRRELPVGWWTDWREEGASFLASPTYLHQAILSRLGALRLVEIANGFAFPGYLPLVLGAAAFLGRRQSERTRTLDRSAALRSVGLGALALLAGAAGLGALALAWYVRGGERITFAIGDRLVRIHGAWRPALAGVAGLATAAWLVRRARFAPVAAVRHALDAWCRWRQRHRQDAVVYYALLAAGTLWLAFGAPIGLWPLVYDLPGFNFIRVPLRFTILSVLGLAVLAGFGFDWMAARLRPRWRLSCAALVVVCLAAEFLSPLPLLSYRLDVPDVDRWLATRAKPFVVLEVPFSKERDHTNYMLYSTVHWQKMVNGYSGMRPGLPGDFYPELRQFPTEKGLAILARLGVTYVVVHTDRYDPDARQRLDDRLSRLAGSIKLEYEAGGGRVYSLRHQEPATPSPR